MEGPSYTYDEMDRLKTRTDALSRTESYDYDKNGNLTKFTDRKSQQATFAYDALNRQTGATYPNATVTFGYDAIGRLTSVNESVGGTITWTYDTVSSGHHPRVQETTTPGTVTVEYDEIGRRLKLSATGQTDVTYTYDKNSRLKTVTQGSQTVALAYDNAGRRSSLTYPNGVVTSYGYDNANRLLSLDHIKTPTTIEALTYQNDAAGNRTKLTRANAAASLIPQAVTNTAFDAANEQTQFNGVTQTFDANGNLTNDGANTYTWDARNRLTGINGGLTASFVYDGLGRRKSKTVNSITTGFWYDGHDVLAELTAGTPTVTYVRSLQVDTPFIRKQSGGDEFYQTDALGSAVALTNASGTSQTQYGYEPFGATTQAGTSTSNSLAFTGREHDATGLYYYRARYYHAKSQRFLREDPWEFRGYDINLYAYVANRPLAFTDPFGLVLEVPPNPVFQQAFGNLIAKSPTGLRMITELQGSPIHYQVLDATGQKVATAYLLTMRIDPVWAVQRTSCSGNREFKYSLERVLAHEMGHLIGRSMKRDEDENDYEMYIINQYENPVARDLHEPLRTQHIEPPCPKSAR